MRKLKKYKPTKFMAKTSHYDKDAADYAVMFIESLCHTKGTWAGKPFELIDWQEQIIRDLFGVLKPNGYRQFNTAYIEIPKKQGKSELAAAVALLLLCGDGEERAEVYGCAADRNQAKIPTLSVTRYTRKPLISRKAGRSILLSILSFTALPRMRTGRTPRSGRRQTPPSVLRWVLIRSKPPVNPPSRILARRTLSGSFG